MTALLVALLLAGVDAGPKLSATDDFREMVAAFEQSSGCEAVELYRCPQEDYRIVKFRCASFDAAVLFVRRDGGDWTLLQRPFIRPVKRAPETGI